MRKEKYYYDLYKPVYCMIDPLENPSRSVYLDRNLFIEKCKIGWNKKSDESKNKALENLRKGQCSDNNKRFKSKEIKAFNLTTENEIIFNSLFEAEKILGIPRASISQILNTNHSRTRAKGYTFKFL